MPYILPKQREDLANEFMETIFFSPNDAENPGELNYLITCFVIKYLENQGTSYTTMNDILGVLEAVKQEFYRRVVAPYEDEKIKENGDVY